MPDYLNGRAYHSTDEMTAVKETFKFIGSFLDTELSCAKLNASVLDIGCASGALISYLATRFSNLLCTGVDVDTKSIRLAQQQDIPNSTFVKASGLQLPFSKDLYDVTISMATLGIFNEQDSQMLIEEALRCTKSGGVVILFSNFNDHATDVLIQHRKYANGSLGAHWECGHNMWSQETVEEWVVRLGQRIQFVEFPPKVNINQRADPARSWTFFDDRGTRLLTNGLNLLLSPKFAIIRKV